MVDEKIEVEIPATVIQPQPDMFWGLGGIVHRRSLSTQPVLTSEIEAANQKHATFMQKLSALMDEFDVEAVDVFWRRWKTPLPDDPMFKTQSQPEHRESRGTEG